ncbi:MAG: VOC family protein [Cyanobacteriota bacterium]|nr:VOC family protein [Cyanobacteriota bacterium]
MEFQYAYTRLNVTDYDACLQFYRDTLGFRVTYQEEGYAELETGTTKITLLQKQKLKTVVGSQDIELSNSSDRISLAFKVRNLDEATQFLKGKGVEFTGTPWEFPDWGFTSTFFRDPDGNLIELQQLLT